MHASQNQEGADRWLAGSKHPTKASFPNCTKYMSNNDSSSNNSDNSSIKDDSSSNSNDKKNEKKNKKKDKDTNTSTELKIPQAEMLSPKNEGDTPTKNNTFRYRLT